MTVFRSFVLIVMVALGLSACTISEPPSRGQIGSDLILAEPDLDSGFRVAKVNVSVPKSLVVSEENMFLPQADIVWRGDPIGDRYRQVRDIVQNALSRASAGHSGGRAVVMDVVVTRFHALTDLTRATIGGRHNVQYDVTLRDASTGAVLVPTRHINASVRGSGGAIARAEEAAGRTQKVVITEALMASIDRALASKAGLSGGLASKMAHNPAHALP